MTLLAFVVLWRAAIFNEHFECQSTICLLNIEDCEIKCLVALARNHALQSELKHNLSQFQQKKLSIDIIDFCSSFTMHFW